MRAIQGSLAIEGNTLSLEQVTAVLEGKRVIGPPRDVLEARNALRAYDALEGFNVFSPHSFLKAHRLLMDGLLPDAGRWRSGNVGIRKGKKVSHAAPPAARVPALMEELFRYVKSDRATSLAIRSCVFHYEAAFIHPFMDGNGRAARLWQTAILRKQNPVFSFVPVESMIKRKQREYYRALEAADAAGESTPFVEFMLAAICEALDEFMGELETPAPSAESRLQSAREHFRDRLFSRRDYLLLLKTISPATASRDLRDGAVQGVLKKRGEANATRYRFTSRD